MDVEQAGGRSQRVIDDPGVDERRRDIFLDGNEAPRAPEDVGRGFRQPGEFGDGIDRVHRAAGDGIETRLRALGFQARRLRFGAPIGPHDVARQRPVRVVERDQPIELRGETDGAHASGRRAGLRQTIGHRAPGLGADQIGVLLLAIGGGAQGGIGDLASRPDLAGRVEHHGSDGRGSDIDGENEIERGGHLGRLLTRPRRRAAPASPPAARRRSCGHS